MRLQPSMTIRGICLHLRQNGYDTPDVSVDDVHQLSNLLEQSSSLAEGKRIHELIGGSGLEGDAFFKHKLLNMYKRLGAMDEAWLVFKEMEEKTVVAWTCMIGLYAHKGHHSEAFCLFYRMQQQGVQANEVTYVAILGACIRTPEVDFLHKRIVVCGFQLDTIVCTALINAYGRCGSVKLAHEVFNGMLHRDTAAWNSIICLLSNHEQHREAHHLQWRMRLEGTMPNKATCVAVLNSCSDRRDMLEGMRIHAYAEERCYASDMIVQTALLNMYAKLGNLATAQKLFDGIFERDVVAWNSMITAYSHSRCHKEAFRCFRRMMLAGVQPNGRTFVIILNACFSPRHLSEGELVTRLVDEIGSGNEIPTGTAAMNMYSRCGSSSGAVECFRKLHTPSLMAWNSILSTFLEAGECHHVFFLFRLMLQDGTRLDKTSFITLLNACCSDEFLETGKLLQSWLMSSGLKIETPVQNALVSMYSRCGSSEEALQLVVNMPDRDVVSWTSLVAAYTRQSMNREALRVFQMMLQDGVRANDVSFTVILNACGGLASFARVKMVEAILLETSFMSSSVEVSNSLLSALGKCGRVEAALECFHRITSRDSVSWNTIIAAAAQQGHGLRGVELFRLMLLDGAQADGITLASLLFAFSHAGLIPQACTCFASVQQDFGLTADAELYLCMADILTRAGWMKMAEEVVRTVEVLRGNVLAWMTLLHGCKTHGETELGRISMARILAFKPEATAPYLAMHNLFAGAGKWNDAAVVRKKMAELGPKKEAGLSWIEIGCRVHEFKVGDRSHPQSREIYKELRRLNELMREREGYNVDRKLVVYDVGEEEKDWIVKQHSEKLAIAFGLIATSSSSNGERLSIIKNLRVCGDCHTATKFISKLTRREILVRDTHRFHLFKDGTCSCGDYW